MNQQARLNTARVVAIEFGGEAIYECAACGKHIGKPP
jgi:hypothetical protein